MNVVLYGPIFSIRLSVFLHIFMFVSGMYACQSTRVAVRLTKMEQEKKNRLLLEAVASLHVENVEFLLKSGANPNWFPQSQNKDLRVTPFSRALVKSNEKIIKLLKNYGGTLTMIFPDKHDFTKLYDTCQLLNFSEKKVAMLYEDLFKEKQDAFGRSWLHALALDKRYNNESYKHLWKKLTTYFLEHLTTDDLATRDFFGNPPLYYIKVSNNRRLHNMVNKYDFDKTVENILGDTAVQRSHNSRFFFYRKLNMHLAVPTIDTALLEDNIAQIIKKFPDGFNFFDVEGVLHAVSYDSHKAFAILNHCFDDLNVQDNRGNTLLHYLVSIYNHNYQCNHISGLLKKMIKGGLNPNHLNQFGCSPLHVASFKNKECLVKILLAEGADPLKKLTDTGVRARDLTRDPKIKRLLAEFILKQRKEYVATLLVNRKKQEIAKVLGELIADFETQEIDKETGNVKISYDD